MPPDEEPDRSGQVLDARTRRGHGVERHDVDRAICTHQEHPGLAESPLTTTTSTPSPASSSTARCTSSGGAGDAVEAVVVGIDSSGGLHGL